MPRPAAVETVDEAPTPAMALPTDFGTDEEVMMEEELPVAVLVTGALVVSAEDPSAVRPVAAMDIRLSLADLVV